MVKFGNVPDYSFDHMKLHGDVPDQGLLYFGAAVEVVVGEVDVSTSEMIPAGFVRSEEPPEAGYEA